MTVKAIDAEKMQIVSAEDAFNARGAEVGSDLIINGAVITGGVHLSRAHIAGELSARGAQIVGLRQDWAIAAPGLIVDQGVALSGAKLAGGMSFAGARIGQNLNASTIEIDGSGRAVEADVMHLAGNWIMRGSKIKGSVRFAGAQINGQVAFTESRIEGSGDLAIRADGASIRGGWFMGRAHIKGLVRLPAAHLGNEMRLRATTIEVATGPALFANGVRIARELVLDGGFATKGGVALDHAEIEGQIDLTGSRIVSAALGRGGTPFKSNYDPLLEARYDDSALSLVDTRLDRLIMPQTAADRPRGIVDLSRAHVGSYEDTAAAWHPPLRGRKKGERGRSADGRDIDHMVLDGFVYDHLEHPTGTPAEDGAPSDGGRAARVRRQWLEGQSDHDLDTHFKPQAWMQLASRLAAQGYHDDAREIAIARRRRQRKGRSAGRSARLQGWLLDVFALYGFNPWRTVMWMAFFILMFAGCVDLGGAGLRARGLQGRAGVRDGAQEQLRPGRYRCRRELSGVRAARLLVRRVRAVRELRLRGALATAAELQAVRRAAASRGAGMGGPDVDADGRRRALRALCARDGDRADPHLARRHRVRRPAEGRRGPALEAPARDGAATLTATHARRDEGSRTT